ncbi:MAG: hypothetical protein WBB28_09305 [Crinalium sp.]
MSISLVTSLLTVGIGLHLAASADLGNANSPEQAARPVHRPQENPGKENRPAIRLPGNRNIPVSKFLNREHFQSQLRKDLGAEFKSFELVTYKDYIDKYLPGTTGATDIADDRMVAILEISFPKGLKTDNAEYTVATIRSVRDGLSGELIEYEITGQPINQGNESRVVNP